MTGTKIMLTVKRNAGNTDTIDISKYHGSADQKMFDKIKKDTAAADRGNVEKIEYTHYSCNMQDLVKNYNNINNEGRDGYIPAPDYFKALPEFVETEVTEIFE